MKLTLSYLMVATVTFSNLKCTYSKLLNSVQYLVTRPLVVCRIISSTTKNLKVRESIIISI